MSFLTRSNVPTILAGIGGSTRIVVSERVLPSAETGLQFGWRVLRRLIYDRADDRVPDASHGRLDRKQLATGAIVIPNALRPLPP